MTLKIKINWNGAKLKEAKAAAQAGKPFTLLEGLKLDFRFIILSIIVCAAVFGYGLARIRPMQKELVEIKSKRVQISSLTANDTLDAFSELGSRYRKKIRALDDLLKNQMYATYPLDAIPAALPGGVWLEGFDLGKRKDGSIELTLTGEVYLEDNDKEFESVSIFLANLKKDPDFSRYFKEINISSIDQKLVENKSVTVFSIVCRNIPEKK